MRVVNVTQSRHLQVKKTLRFKGVTWLVPGLDPIAGSAGSESTISSPSPLREVILTEYMCPALKH